MSDRPADKVGHSAGVTDRLEELADITLEEYPYRVDLYVGILADPENKPEEWGENVKMFVEDELSNFHCVVEVEVSERSVGAGTDRPGGPRDE